MSVSSTQLILPQVERLLASGTLTGSCAGYAGSTKPFFGEVHLWNMEGLGTGARWTNFNMYLDGNLAPGNHAVSALDLAPGTDRYDYRCLFIVFPGQGTSSLS